MVTYKFPPVSRKGKKLVSRNTPVLAACVIAVILGAGAARADNFYAGIQFSGESSDARFKKRTSNKGAATLSGQPVSYCLREPCGDPGNRAVSAYRGFVDDDSNDRFISGYGVLLGYSWDDAKTGRYFRAELDYRTHGGRQQGRLHGIKDIIARDPGVSVPSNPDPTDYGTDQYDFVSGESWPDSWSFEKKYSYGISLRAGWPLDFLERTLGEGSGVYLRLGVGRARVDYVNSYEDGCCAVPGSRLSRGIDFTVWTPGVGVMAPVGENTEIQVEAYVSAWEKEKIHFTIPTAQGYEPVLVTHELDNEEYGLGVRLVHHFGGRQ